MEDLHVLDLSEPHIEFEISAFHKYLMGLPGGSRATQSPKGTVGHVKQYLEFAQIEPSHNETHIRALLDTTQELRNISNS